jgi:hypothetical protein
MSHILECIYCGKEFESKRDDTKYCSNSHRQLAYLQRNREYQRRMYSSSPPAPSKPKGLSMEEQIRQLKNEIMAEFREKEAKELDAMYERVNSQIAERAYLDNLESLKESIVKVIRQLLELDGRTANSTLKYLLDVLKDIIDSKEFEQFKEDIPYGYIQNTLHSFLYKAWDESLIRRHYEFHLSDRLKRDLPELIANLT